MKLFRLFLPTTCLVLAAPMLHADIVSSGPDHYVLRMEARSELPPDQLWKRLVDPASWWHPDHSYSGDAANLSLDPVAGGAWREDWAGGSVVHGEVLYAAPPFQLRLDAPFGPLQGMAVDVVWTISIVADGDGSMVSFEEIGNGSSASGLTQLAPAVDGVKQQALERLIAPDLE
jgi:uncharacterized protein YndB with AHSA1/START domain